MIHKKLNSREKSVLEGYELLREYKDERMIYQVVIARECGFTTGDLNTDYISKCLSRYLRKSCIITTNTFLRWITVHAPGATFSIDAGVKDSIRVSDISDSNQPKTVIYKTADEVVNELLKNKYNWNKIIDNGLQR